MNLPIAPALLALVALLTLGRAASPPSMTTLSVPGRASATPWVAADGSLVAVAWGASAGAQSDVFVAVSRDGGQTFGIPVRANADPGEARLGGELPPRIAIVPRASSPASGQQGGPADIVVLWTAGGAATAVKLARSHDGGRTFGASVTLQSAAAHGDRGWPSLALDARGTAHALWLDHRGLAPLHADGTASGGRAPHDGVAMARKSGLYYVALQAGAGEPGTSGREGGREREITNGVCYCCKTALAARADGTLFAAWRHVYPGNVRDIALSVSPDAGRSFSPPVRVSADDWKIDGCPDDGPAVAVDDSGTAHVVWPTVTGSQEPEGAIFYASTTDGVTFTRRFRVATLGSAKPSHPQIAIDGSGRILVAWDEIVKGTRVAAVREVKRSTSAEPSPGPVVTLSERGPASYPVMASTTDGVIAVWTSGTPEASVIGVRRLSIPAGRP
jgi:hypothetical protein